MELPETWSELKSEVTEEYFRELQAFVEAERNSHTIFPPKDQVFAALEATPLADVRVLLLGQDPYHGEGQAHGLCFSVARGIRVPPSLRNIFKELADDIGCAVPGYGCLSAWAEQGVLLLNTVLTVRSGEANSHRRKGWERLTDRIIQLVNEKCEPVVFVLWGGPAQKKRKLVDESRHKVIASAHPSPLSAHRGFFGSRPFSQINAALGDAGFSQIDWELPSG